MPRIHWLQNETGFERRFLLTPYMPTAFYAHLSQGSAPHHYCHYFSFCVLAFIIVYTCLYLPQESQLLEVSRNFYQTVGAGWNFWMNKGKNQMNRSAKFHITDKTASLKLLIWNAWDYRHGFWRLAKILELHISLSKYITASHSAFITHAICQT